MALQNLGLKPYNYYEVKKNKDKHHFQLWLSAIDAKYSGIGVPFQKEDFDLLLENYDVSRTAWTIAAVCLVDTIC